MGQTAVAVPLINNNEDSVRVVAWHARTGERVPAGGLLATVETAKAAMDLEAERDGYVRWRAACPDGEAAVGSTLLILTDTPDEPFDPPVGTKDPAEARAAAAAESAVRNGPARATLQARMLAARLGVDLGGIPAGATGTITAELVRAAAGRPEGEAGPAPAAETGRRAVASRGVVPAVIAGDGAHARWIADTLRRAGGFEVVGCTSRDLPRGARAGDLTVLGADDDLPEILASGVRASFVGVGSARSGRRSNDLRARIFARLEELGFALPALVDPDASVSESASLGAGAVVGAKAVVSAHARVGRNVLVNAGAIVCHDAVVEDHVHLTPGAILAGTTFVGEGSTVGMAATVLDGTRVGRRCLVPNGARVVRDLPDDSVAD